MTRMLVERAVGFDWAKDGAGRGDVRADPALARGFVDALDGPMPTIRHRPVTVDGAIVSLLDSSKPPYRVPSMAEIAAIPKNGYRIVSTFSGCGGSCLGFEMAGYQVLWASEFVHAAQEVYRLNHPGVILDIRDIRQVAPSDILAAIGCQPGEIDILEGSPPCASFSTAGKRAKDWGKVKAYSDTAQRSDDLFYELIRILDGLKPKVFVAENVSGLVKGVAKGYFKRILAAMRSAGYVVEARLLDAQWLGVPQMRQRIIFVGVRDDLGVAPAFPKPLPYRYSVREALPWIAEVRQSDVFNEPDRIVTDGPCSSVTTVGMSAKASKRVTVRITGRTGPHFARVETELDQPFNAVIVNDPEQTRYEVETPTERRKFTIAELKRICAFPDDFVLTGTYAQQWERLGRAVPPLMMRAVADVIRDEVLAKCP